MDALNNYITGDDYDFDVCIGIAMEGSDISTKDYHY